jgi:metal-responsive CopG/Arc/MetJ family transcriptional regulator
MKTAVSIPDRVFDAAEQVSKRMGVSRSRLYTLAIEQVVKRERTRGVQKALDAVYAKVDSRLDSALAAMQFASLDAEEEEW